MHDPEGWRGAGPWHDAAWSILESERFRQRGIFDPVAVGELLAAHEAGARLSQSIGVMVGVELCCRQELDGGRAEEREEAARPTAPAAGGA
ncbi:MAG: hypothetical protein JNN27_24170 [Planctomycetes bacterium]|nr:hypothetical protein [Planctomycetota bacterium]